MEFRRRIIKSGTYKGMGVVQIVDGDCLMSSSEQPMADEEVRMTLKALRDNPRFPFTPDELLDLYDERGEPIIHEEAV